MMRLDPFPCQHCGATIAQTDGFKLVLPSPDPSIPPTHFTQRVKAFCGACQQGTVWYPPKVVKVKRQKARQPHTCAV
jgi:hypothetical protein